MGKKSKQEWEKVEVVTNGEKYDEYALYYKPLSSEGITFFYNDKGEFGLIQNSAELETWFPHITDLNQFKMAVGILIGHNRENG